MTHEKQKYLATQILKAVKVSVWIALFFSLIINLLMLTVPLYMLQVFDRVLTSQSIDTLIYLTVIAIFALIVMSLLDVSRGRMLLRVGEWLDQKLGFESLSRSVSNKLQGGNYSQQSLSDVNTLRQFCSGSSIFAFFDAPWIVIYLLIIYFLSVPLGVIATIGACLLALLAYINESVSREPNQVANGLYSENMGMVGSMLQQAETIQAMGMQTPLVERWIVGNQQFLKVQQAVAQHSSIIVSLAKLIRLILQILIMAVGAFFVIRGELSPGGMIAASIIMARGLAPIEQGMGAWKSMLDTLSSYKRLRDYLQTPSFLSVKPIERQLQGVVQVDDVSLTIPGRQTPILQNVKLMLPQGKQLAIIGPMAAGKSSLARLMAGITEPSFGAVRLDNINVFKLPDDLRQQKIGYLSQVDALFPGSIADNINRLNNKMDQQVIAAAQFVNMHQTVEHLSENYHTPIEGYNLSVGEKRRIALARAFYGQPCLVVLDEPEANLDGDGLLSLQQALAKAREQGITVVYVTQHPQIARLADQALVLRQGRVQDYGSANQLINKWLG